MFHKRETVTVGDTLFELDFSFRTWNVSRETKSSFAGTVATDRLVEGACIGFEGRAALSL